MTLLGLFALLFLLLRLFTSPRPVLVPDLLVPPLSLLLIFVHPVLLLLPVFALLPPSSRYPALLLLHFSPKARTSVTLRCSGPFDMSPKRLVARQM